MRWEAVRERLNAAQVEPDVRMHAIKIFELMVGAEATAHHIVPERVVFEAGAWNSLAQVVGAATLIDALDTAQWSASGFPSGGAVSLAGAAIVDYLSPPRSRGRPLPKARSLVRSGTGFGSLSFRNNCTRLLCFEVDQDAFLERDARLAQTRSPGRPDQRTRQ